MPGAERTRGLVCNKEAHELVTTGTIGSTDIPCTMDYGLLRALPGVHDFFSHRRLSISTCRAQKGQGRQSTCLAPAKGRQNHTPSPSASISHV